MSYRKLKNGFELTCNSCNSLTTFKDNEEAYQLGWILNGEKHLCSDCSKPMKENKLSREEFEGILYEVFALYDSMSGATRESDQVFKQIKSLLAPIPEDKLDEFVGKWRRKIHDEIGGHAFSLSPLVLEQMLKEYDGLKEGNEYISVLPGVGAIKVTK